MEINKGNLSATPTLEKLLTLVDEYGSLDLSGTAVTSLPKGLHVGGNLDLSDTPITSLPAGLQVSGNLDLYKTQITVLPESLQVGGNVFSDMPIMRIEQPEVESAFIANDERLESLENVGCVLQHGAEEASHEAAPEMDYEPEL